VTGIGVVAAPGVGMDPSRSLPQIHWGYANAAVVGGTEAAARRTAHEGFKAVAPGPSSRPRWLRDGRRCDDPEAEEGPRVGGRPSSPSSREAPPPPTPIT
jgi:hypothetical protein